MRVETHEETERLTEVYRGIIARQRSTGTELTRALK